MNDIYPIQEIRSLFPALCRLHNGNKAVYLDGPGGSQVVATAITAMTNYMRRGVANTHGKFPSSEETEALIESAKAALGDLLACAPNEIAFGANATSNMFAVSRALSRSWNPGDEIVVSEMDHHSHIDTWILSARDRGIVVRHLPVDPKALTLDLSDLDAIVNAKTRLVAVGYASNAVGTINDVARISRRCREVGALLSVDAVHIAPHKAIDMDAIGADMLFCSVYKFFGGHIGIAAIRKNVFEALDTYRLHPAPPRPPASRNRDESHEAIASIVPAVDFIAGLGTSLTRRERLVSGFERIERHENALAGIIRQAHGCPRPEAVPVRRPQDRHRRLYAGRAAARPRMPETLRPIRHLCRRWRLLRGNARPQGGRRPDGGWIRSDSRRTTPKRKRNCLSGPSAKS
ncbi:MAG: aminotransferase class V-fold PLP-dependent enzyme [Bilophila wadsworthia]